MVALAQLSEHLTEHGLIHARRPNWDVMLLNKRMSLSRQYVLLKREPNGFSVTHGKYRELRRLVHA